jgi:CHAD domain-containing protein
MKSKSLKVLKAGSLAKMETTKANLLAPKDPGAVSAPVIKPPDSVRTAVWFSQVLRQRLADYLHRLRQCRKKLLAKPVHNLRVATRRLVSPISLLDPIYPGCKTREAIWRLKKQFRSLGDLRDANILCTTIAQQRETFPALKVLLKQLRRRENRLIKTAARKIERCQKHNVARAVDRLIAELKKTSGDSRRQKKLNSIALRCAREAFAETQRRRRLIDYSDLATIHHTRIAFKKFRYLMESLPPEMTGLGKREFRDLNRYQGKMGDIQDLVVIQTCLQDFLKHKEGSAAKLHSFSLHLRRRRELALRRFREWANPPFQFRPPACEASATTK